MVTAIKKQPKERPIKVNNFTTIESEYGPFIVNRHCAYQAEVLIKTGQPHIQEELNKILAVINQLPENSITIDAGANIGLVAIPIAKQVAAKRGTVYAFEAQRMMSYALCGSAALNDLENLIIHNTALGATTGTLNGETPDYSKPQDFGLFSLAEQDTTQPKTQSQTTQAAQTTTSATIPVTIPVTTIDTLALPRLDFLKIDVEGMEIDVLEGGRQSIKEFLPWCWIEYWKTDIEAIKAQFAGLDYQFYIMDQLNMLCAPTQKLEKSALTINAKKA